VAAPKEATMSTVDPRAQGVPDTDSGGGAAYAERRGDGWILFAGVLLLMAGTMNVIDGIAAISNSTFFTENARYVVSNLNTLGWIVLLLGGAQVIAAFGVWARTPGVRWFGVAVAAVNGIAQLLFIPAYPFWSLALFTLDILVIYGLIAYGKRSHA
jgi:hypothetical protein